MLMLLPLICSGVEPASEKDPKSTVKSEKEYAQLTSAIALKRKIPLIQVKYKTPKQDIAFETAQYDFVSASKDIETTFQAASISKVVFSYIVMRMVDRGEIDLDKPLWEYLGYLEERFKDAYPDNPDKSRQNEEWAKRLTARIVLTHGTGLPNWMVRGKPGNGKLIFKCEPNTKYTYSGEGIHYLQRVVEHITGKSLEELAVQEVFKPLGMNYTSYEWREDYNKLAAHGYNNNLECSGQAAKRAANAAYTMRTNVKDFSLFLNALMKGKGPLNVLWISKECILVWASELPLKAIMAECGRTAAATVTSGANSGSSPIKRATSSISPTVKTVAVTQERTLLTYSFRITIAQTCRQ